MTGGTFEHLDRMRQAAAEQRAARERVLREHAARHADVDAAVSRDRPPRVGGRDTRDWPPVVDAHLAYMDRRGLSRNAKNARLRVLRRLSEHFPGLELTDLTREDLKAWQEVRTRQVARQTVHHEASNVRMFFRWACLVEQLLDLDPSDALILPKVPRRIPRPMSEEDLGAALAAAPWDLALVLALAAFAGLRAAEIAGLDWRDLTFGDEPNLRLIGKGDKERVVPMSAGLARYLLAAPHRRGPVIPRRDGGTSPNRPHVISHLANDHLHRCGIDGTLHQLRHRFGTQAYRATRDLRAVQELMGHSSPTTTAGYAAASGTVGREAVDAIDHVRVTAPPPALRQVT